MDYYEDVAIVTKSKPLTERRMENNEHRSVNNGISSKALTYMHNWNSKRRRQSGKQKNIFEETMVKLVQN